MVYVKHAVKYFPGGKTTVTVLANPAGLHKVSCMTQFDSGNYFHEKDTENLSLVAAEGLVAFWTAS
jgi:hypothetical protein